MPFSGKKERTTRLEEYSIAVRANRQLAVVLQAQGLNEDGTRFAYRAQMLQRTVFRLQGGIHSFGSYFFSLFLDLLAGYGYKPWRSFLAYIIVIILFAVTYFIVGRTVGRVLTPLSSFIFSMTSFHGRGFFPGGIGLDDPLTVLAAIEAFVGLLIEVTFIATLTPLKEFCEQCGQQLWVGYHGHRTVTKLDGLWRLTIVVRRCMQPKW